MECGNERLLFEVKQGEQREFSFTLLEGDKPLNLTGYAIDFEVRLMPNVNVEPLFVKHIDVLQDVDGVIDEPLLGKFTIQIYQSDINTLPPMDCYVSMYLVDGDTRICISGDGSNFSVMRICGC